MKTFFDKADSIIQVVLFGALWIVVALSLVSTKI